MRLLHYWMFCLSSSTLLLTRNGEEPYRNIRSLTTDGGSRLCGRCKRQQKSHYCQHAWLLSLIVRLKSLWKRKGDLTPHQRAALEFHIHDWTSPETGKVR